MRTKAKKPASARKKKTGRPSELDREALLDVAERLFSDKGFEGATTRELSKLAGCNAALISYHFGSKEGLYQAVLVRYFEQIRTRGSTTQDSPTALAQAWPELKTADQREFCAAFFDLARMIATHSPMQKIIHREIMTGAVQMASALSRSEGGAHRVIARRLEELKKTGKLRTDLDLRLGVIGLVGPLVYSCIAAPLLKAVYGIGTENDAYLRGLAIHQTRTFFEGWGA